MSTTTEETTVELRTEDGSTGPIPMSEFEQRADAALDDLRTQQLSFDVGGHEVTSASLKLSADLRIHRGLAKGSTVKVTITTAAGELLARTEGRVLGVNFKDEYSDGFIVATDRIHTVKL